MLKLVPFNTAWITHDKTDLHAIYRRPQMVEDLDTGHRVPRRDADGFIVWDLTSPLPIKQHNIWEAKGYQYVTLADRESLHTAARTGTLTGGSVREFDQHATGGPWNYRKYAAAQAEVASDALDNLRADVEQFGSEAVEAIRRRTDPTFRLPESFRQAPKAKTKGAA